MKYKLIEKKDFTEFLKKHHGKRVTNEYASDYVNYYECDDNTLVIENTKTLQIWVEYDREKFYEEKRKILKWNEFEPFLLKQTEIMKLPNSKEQLMNEFFHFLKLKKEYPLSNIDLKKVDKSIKAYGYEKAIENLYTNILVFAGEYIREKRGGDWTIRKDTQASDKSNYKPVFVDEKGKNYDFDLNVILLKTFFEKKRINIKQQIEFALLPNPFQVEPAPKNMR